MNFLIKIFYFEQIKLIYGKEKKEENIYEFFDSNILLRFKTILITYKMFNLDNITTKDDNKNWRYRN